jgi:hypothetical protein
MNKTFLLIAAADYTEGSMLVTVDSIEEFQRLYQEYYEKKLAFFTKEFPNGEHHLKGIAWHDFLKRWNDADSRFQKEFNNKPFDFEISTASGYLTSGLFEGNLKDGTLTIYGMNESDKCEQAKEGYWCTS